MDFAKVQTFNGNKSNAHHDPSASGVPMKKSKAQNTSDDGQIRIRLVKSLFVLFRHGHSQQRYLLFDAR